ncbi:MAG: Rrf2 family transcriptional regulator [Sandaracinaceae bacterium]|nr:Rrf2 family transcriptional regulator [Sandaracinaceae bacterium]
MRLHQRTDFAIRLLIYLGLAGSGPVSVGRVASSFAISEHHLAKVAQRLRDLGYVRLVRGRSGGLELLRDPEDIRMGELVRQLEQHILVECFEPATDQCRISSACSLKRLLERARSSFFAELDRSTLADLITPRRDLVRLLSIGATSS